MKPYLYCIDNGDGTPAMSEACVAEDAHCLQESVDAVNAECDPDAFPQRVVACYSGDQVAETLGRMHKAHALLLQIWPDGEKCEHRVAREIFRTLAGGGE